MTQPASIVEKLAMRAEKEASMVELLPNGDLTPASEKIVTLYAAKKFGLVSEEE